MGDYTNIRNLISSMISRSNENTEYHRKYLEEHPLDAWKLEVEDESTPALIELESTFPNISFSRDDLWELSGYDFRISKNKNTIFKIESAITSQRYGGRTVDSSERKKLAEAQENTQALEDESSKAFSTFFQICEALNNPENQESSTFDIEEVFGMIYDYGFQLQSKNPILKKYYQRYKAYKDQEKETTTLLENNVDLKQQLDVVNKSNDNFKNENDTLNQKVTSLQSMLSKTLDFCTYVRNSRLGKVFFRNKIKELPVPDNSEQDDFELDI